MKKLFLFVAAVAMSIAASATELFNGSHQVTWDTPLNLEATKFADVVAGQKIVVTYTEASDGIEFKVPDLWHHLSGTRRDNGWISGEGTYESYLTLAGVADVQAHGLQIAGAHFTCTKVEVIDGKALSDIKEGTAWTGFCWMDETCGAMEFFKDNFTQFDLAKVRAIRFYCSPEAEGSTYTINLKQTWQSDITSEAGSGLMTELTLTDEIRTKLAEGDFVIVQLCRGEGQNFNLTDIVLVMEEEPVVKYTLELYVNDTTMGSVELVNAFKHTGPLDGQEGKTVYEVAEGDTVILRATANEGYEFKEWKFANELNDSINWAPVVDCLYCGVTTTPDELTFVMNGDIAVMAEFAAKGEGIEQTNANAKATKSFRNGMLVIEKNGKFYNALGAEVK